MQQRFRAAAKLKVAAREESWERLQVFPGNETAKIARWAIGLNASLDLSFGPRKR